MSELFDEDYTGEDYKGYLAFCDKQQTIVQQDYKPVEINGKQYELEISGWPKVKVTEQNLYCVNIKSGPLYACHRNRHGRYLDVRENWHSYWLGGHKVSLNYFSRSNDRGNYDPDVVGWFLTTLFLCKN